MVLRQSTSIRVVLFFVLLFVSPILSARDIRRNISLYLQTMKTQVAVTFPTGETYNLNGQIIGVMPEISFASVDDRSEWGASLGVFVGTAEIGRSLAELQSSALGNFDYQANNIRIFGAELALSYLLRPSFRNVALGVKVPLRWMRTPWPVPAAGYSLSPQTDISASYLLEARLERESLTWIQNIGFYKKWGNVLWSIGISSKF